MKDFFIFSINGGPGVILYYIIYFSLFKIFNVNYFYASIVGGIINIIISFWVHGKWTFKTKGKKGKQFTVFFTYSAINSILLYILVNKSPLGKIWSQVILTLVILPFVNYFVTKKIMTK